MNVIPSNFFDQSWGARLAQACRVFLDMTPENVSNSTGGPSGDGPARDASRTLLGPRLVYG